MGEARPCGYRWLAQLIVILQVEQGLDAILAAVADASPVARPRRLAALLELERRSGILRNLRTAKETAETLWLQLRETGSGDVHALCLCVAALETLACSRKIIEAEARMGRSQPESIADIIVHELVGAVTTPRVSWRLMQRCMIALLRIGAARPEMPRPGLSAAISVSLREGNSQCRRVSLELLAQCKGSVGNQEGLQICRSFRKDADYVVRAAALKSLQAWRPMQACMFEEAVSSLNDDIAEVREEALGWLGNIAMDNRSFLFPKSKKSEVKLTDSCFMQ
eukprot:415982-Hanusia_phi.AAC.1